MLPIIEKKEEDKLTIFVSNVPNICLPIHKRSLVTSKLKIKN